MSTPKIHRPMALSFTHQIPGQDHQASVSAMWFPQKGRYMPASVSIAHPLVPITGGVLRHTPLRAMSAQRLREPLLAANPELLKLPAVKAFTKGTKGRAPSAKDILDPPAKHLEPAAIVFRLARIVGAFPVRSVQTAFALDYSDAKRWCALAKKQGLIPQEEP